ncbi:hypothetical protein PMAYCL1PPCAC_22939, partial [Pristionchus mayeri]
RRHDAGVYGLDDWEAYATATGGVTDQRLHLKSLQKEDLASSSGADESFSVLVVFVEQVAQLVHYGVVFSLRELRRRDEVFDVILA